jgi:hypothetical protein
MYKRDIMVRVWNSAMYRTFDVRVTLQKEYDVQKHMIIAQNKNFQERRILAQLIMLIALMVERKLNLALYRIFLKLSTWKKRIR